MRPRSLADLARLAAQGVSFDFCLAEFLDEFQSAPNSAALVTAPQLLAPAIGETGKVRDAYLAAVAEQLAIGNGYPAPEWAYADSRKLHYPWFASGMPSLRTVLLLESPVAFRSRNLFVSENALARA